MEPKLPPLPLDLDHTPSHLLLPIRAGELVRLLHQWGREVYAAGQGGWVSVGDRLPPDETPVIVLLRGIPDIGELRWDHPGHEDAYEAHRYWDNPNDDGKCWEWGDITHWMPVPEAPAP